MEGGGPGGSGGVNLCLSPHLPLCRVTGAGRIYSPVQPVPCWAGLAPAETQTHREFPFPDAAAAGTSPWLKSRRCCFSRTRIPGYGGHPPGRGDGNTLALILGDVLITPPIIPTDRTQPCSGQRERVDLPSRGFWGAQAGAEPQPPIPAGSYPHSRWNSRASRPATRPLPTSSRSPGDCKANQGS